MYECINSQKTLNSTKVAFSQLKWLNLWGQQNFSQIVQFQRTFPSRWWYKHSTILSNDDQGLDLAANHRWYADYVFIEQIQWTQIHILHSSHQTESLMEAQYDDFPLLQLRVLQE